MKLTPMILMQPIDYSCTPIDNPVCLALYKDKSVPETDTILSGFNPNKAYYVKQTELSAAVGYVDGKSNAKFDKSIKAQDETNSAYNFIKTQDCIEYLYDLPCIAWRRENAKKLIKFFTSLNTVIQSNPDEIEAIKREFEVVHIYKNDDTLDELKSKVDALRGDEPKMEVV